MRHLIFIAFRLATVTGCAPPHDRNAFGAYVTVNATQDVTETMDFPVLLLLESSDEGTETSLDEPLVQVREVVCEEPENEHLLRMFIGREVGVDDCHALDGGLTIRAEIHPLILDEDTPCDRLNDDQAEWSDEVLAEEETEVWEDKDGCGTWEDSIYIVFDEPGKPSNSSLLD